MLAFDATSGPLVISGHRGVGLLAEMDFSGGTIRWTTWPVDTTIGGHTYTALGALVSVDGWQESADSGADQLTFTMSAANAAMFAAAIGDPATYRGFQARLYLQLFGDNMQPAGASILRWQGYMSKVQTEWQPAGEQGDGSLGTIKLVCMRAGVARSRNSDGLRLTDAQQQVAFPGDTGLRYVNSLLQNPAQWLSVAFQKQ